VGLGLQSADPSTPCITRSCLRCWFVLGGSMIAEYKRYHPSNC